MRERERERGFVEDYRDGAATYMTAAPGPFQRSNAHGGQEVRSVDCHLIKIVTACQAHAAARGRRGFGSKRP